MTTPSETALQRIGRHISRARFQPSTESLAFLRDAFIDTYGCMLIGSTQAVAVKTQQALLSSEQIHPGARAVIYGTD